MRRLNELNDKQRNRLLQELVIFHTAEIDLQAKQIRSQELNENISISEFTGTDLFHVIECSSVKGVQQNNDRGIDEVGFLIFINFISIIEEEGHMNNMFISYVELIGANEDFSKIKCFGQYEDSQYFQLIQETKDFHVFMKGLVKIADKNIRGYLE